MDVFTINNCIFPIVLKINLLLMDNLLLLLLYLFGLGELFDWDRLSQFVRYIISNYMTAYILHVVLFKITIILYYYILCLTTTKTRVLMNNNNNNNNICSMYMRPTASIYRYAIKLCACVQNTDTYYVFVVYSLSVSIDLLFTKTIFFSTKTATILYIICI